jgi:hypothetical protein
LYHVHFLSLSVGLTRSLSLTQLLTATAEVTIIDDDEPGILSFQKHQVEVEETATAVRLLVKRMKGCDGEIKVDYVTADGSALAGEDYTHTQGTLVFEKQVRVCGVEELSNHTVTVCL